MDCIFALLQPHSRTKQWLLRTYIPIPTKEMSIHPYVPFDKGRQVEVGVACTGNIEISSQYPRIACFIILKLILTLPTEKSRIIQWNAVCFPLEYSPINWSEEKKSLFIKVLILTEVQMSHSLHKNSQYTRIITTFDDCFPYLKLNPGNCSSQHIIDKQ